MTTYKSRVWKLGSDVDTDSLAPGAYMKYGVDVIAQYCLEAIRPDFAKNVRAGDVLVAGPNFGIGSSREQAVEVLMHLGLRAVIAPTFGGLFFRNAFNLGLLLITCPEAEKILQDETITLLETGEIERENGTVLMCNKTPDFLMNMIHVGGLMNVLKLRSQGNLDA
ncbi:MAG: 3-isopropylmalate dehydratase [Burkholderiales bacterium]|jgi:3-isopropylmalate/(R)-2-methylmalate dehydratase small subunit|nr:3-isopropylmalate dehydratase [Burkholderiales bacterium]